MSEKFFTLIFGDQVHLARKRKMMADLLQIIGCKRSIEGDQKRCGKISPASS